MNRHRTRVHRLSGRHVNVQGEAEYIVGCAAGGIARVVTLGPLLFFSTETGDAWVLDPDDHLALPLAIAGAAQPTRIIETPDSFAIDWATTYTIHGEVMIFVEAPGNERTVVGYPVREIRRAIRRARAIR